MPEQVVGTPSEASSFGGGEGGIQLSDEDILGISPEDDAAPAPEPATEPAPPAEVAPAPEAEPEKKETPPEAAPTTSTAETPRWMDNQFMRPLLNDKVYGPVVQSMRDRLLAHEELYPTVADARAVKELLPEGIEQLKSLIANKNDTDNLDLQYYSEDPEEQKVFAQNLYSDNPDAFRGMVQVGLDVIKGQNPQEWAYLTQHLVGDSLGNEKVWDWLEYIHEAATKSGDESVAQLLNQFAGVFQKYGLGPRATEDPNMQRVNAARSEVERERDQLQAERFNDFRASVDEQVSSALNTEINSELTRLLPRVSDALRAKVAEDIHKAIQSVVGSDAALKLQLKNLRRTGGINRQTLQQTINLLTAKSKAVLPGAVKRIVNSYTQSIMAKSKEVTDKQTAAASRVDVSSGARPGTGIKPITREEARGMTDEELLNSPRPVARR